MHLTWARVACGVLAACLCCALAHAQPGTPAWFEVAVEGDPCIDGPELVGEVLRLLGTETPPAGVEVHVQALEDRVRFDLKQGTGAETSRDLTDLPRECVARREAISLVLALAIEHALAEERRRQAIGAPEQAEPPAQLSQPEQTAPLVAAESSEEEEEAPEEAPEPTKPSAGLGAQVRMLGGAHGGLLPRPAAEGRLEGELSLGHWAFVLGAGVSSVSRSSLADGELRARALGSSLGLCLGDALGAGGAGQLHGCLDVGLGAVLGEGRGLAQNRRDTTASGTLELGLLGRWPLKGGLVLVWRLSALSQWLRPRYEALVEGMGGQTEVADTTTFPAFGGRALVGMGWQIR